MNYEHKVFDLLMFRNALSIMNNFDCQISNGKGTLYRQEKISSVAYDAYFLDI